MKIINFLISGYRFLPFFCGTMSPDVSVNISYDCIYDKILNRIFLLILNEIVKNINIINFI